MNSQHILQRFARGFFQSLLIRIVAAIFLLPLGCMCVFVPLVYAVNAPADDNLSIVFLVVSMISFVVMAVAVGGMIIGWMLLRRAK